MSTGTEFFIHLSEQQPFLKNHESDATRNAFKTAARVVAASVALAFFAKIGFYYNALLGLGKGALGVVTLKRSEKVFGKMSEEFLQESKSHAIKAIIDLVVMVFKLLAILIYAIDPTKMKKGIADSCKFQIS